MKSTTQTNSIEHYSLYIFILLFHFVTVKILSILNVFLYLGNPIYRLLLNLSYMLNDCQFLLNKFLVDNDNQTHLLSYQPFLLFFQVRKLHLINICNSKHKVAHNQITFLQVLVSLVLYNSFHLMLVILLYKHNLLLSVREWIDIKKLISCHTITYLLFFFAT